MEQTKELYGKTVIDSSDSSELASDYKIELEYYQVKDGTSDKPYGVKIIKRYMENNIVNTEEKVISNICDKLQDTNKVLDILISNKVTPVIATDVLHDLTIGNVI